MKKLIVILALILGMAFVANTRVFADWEVFCLKNPTDVNCINDDTDTDTGGSEDNSEDTTNNTDDTDTGVEDGTTDQTENTTKDDNDEDKEESDEDNSTNCDSNYGGGETCIINKRFQIDKKVKLEGDDDWRDKVTIDLNDDDESDKEIYFRVKIKNLSDEEADFDFDNMEMRDDLPNELDRVGGSGLTEYWDDFEPGESKEFIIKAEIEDDEKDRDEEFEKCVVNKAEVYWDDEFEGADTATVCYTNEEVTELPETGQTALTGIGLGLLLVGSAVKYSKKLLTK